MLVYQRVIYSDDCVKLWVCLTIRDSHPKEPFSKNTPMMFPISDKLIWGWVKTLYPCSSHQNSWDYWIFIPLKMVLIGIDPYPFVDWGWVELNRKFQCISGISRPDARCPDPKWFGGDSKIRSAYVKHGLIHRYIPPYHYHLTVMNKMAYTLWYSLTIEQKKRVQQARANLLLIKSVNSAILAWLRPHFSAFSGMSCPKRTVLKSIYINFPYQTFKNSNTSFCRGAGHLSLRYFSVDC